MFLDPQGVAAWPGEYPDEFRTTLPQLGGYLHYRDGDVPGSPGGYYILAESHRYDFQDPARVARGLLLAGRDALGAETRIEYDIYDLLPVQVTDPVGLTIRAHYDYRVLQAGEITDVNGNTTSFVFSPAGFLTAQFVRGKNGEGDGADPSMRMEYDLLAFSERRQPIFVRSIRRVHHDSEQEQTFDIEWDWMGSYRTWVAAMRVFAYPENQLFPTLYQPDGQLLQPTQSFLGLISGMRKAFKVTPEEARQWATAYLNQLRQEMVSSVPAPLAANATPPFFITDRMSDAELIQRQQLVASLFGGNSDPNNIPQILREVFWLVPMAIGFRLQQERHYLAALDWFQTVYAFNLPPVNRKIYRGLTLEESVTSAYVRVPDWLIDQINPHVVARTSRASSGALVGRKNVYTRFTVMSIVRCFLDYADLEFSRNLAESISRARGLYETATDLLTLPDVRPETSASIPFPDNPVWDSLRLHAECNLAKIHNGMNIAGVRSVAPPAGSTTIFLPSQYRYSALVERAKNLVGIAQQVESAFLSALEQRDTADYTVFQANHDIEVARSSIKLADLKLADASVNEQVAGLQFERAQIQFDHYDGLIKDGLNAWEQATRAALGAAVVFRAAAVGVPRFSFDFLEKKAGAVADFAAATAQFAQTQGSFERREEEWHLQKQLSSKDVQIGQQQIQHAQNQTQVALQERQLSGLQFDHSVAVLDYLSNKFTNAELFDWMSGVLGRVYAYFLQQATSMALLGQAQLAFERQEPAPGFIASDYRQDNSDGTSNGAVDRQGLTGSARLLQDISRLDQYAFDTDQRKLHLTQTFSLAQIAALELQQFRETGLLVFATPTEMFDRESPDTISAPSSASPFP